MKANLSTKYSS